MKQMMMIKIVNPRTLRCNVTFPSLVRSFFTEQSAVTPVTVYKGQVKRNNLYGRLSAVKLTGETVAQTLNDYIREGNIIKKIELERCVKELRKYARFSHALEVLLSLLSSLVSIYIYN